MDASMTIYCHDCGHWFSEALADWEAGDMICPYCECANWDAYSDEADVMEGK